MTEQLMRDAKVPYLETMNDLLKYIQDLKNMEHDYGTAVYAMSMAATATFNFMARTLGVTGFQTNCADLDVLRRTRDLPGPFMIVNLDNALYPQYDLHEQLDSFIHSNIAWLREQAKRHLEENSNPGAYPAHEEVVAHWEALAKTPEE